MFPIVNCGVNLIHIYLAALRLMKPVAAVEGSFAPLTRSFAAALAALLRSAAVSSATIGLLDNDQFTDCQPGWKPT